MFTTVIMILGLLSYLKEFTSVSTVTEDLLLQTFSLTSFLLLFTSILVTGVDTGCDQIKMRMRLLSGKAYLSDPIFCYRNTDDKFPKDMLTTFCYIHGTYTISQEYPVSHFKGKFLMISGIKQHQLTLACSCINRYG